MQKTAPTSLPQRRQEGNSPALTMASRIRAEQGPERAAQYLNAMEPFLAPGERTYIAYTLGLPIPQPVSNSGMQPPMGPQTAMGGGMGGMGSMGGLGNMGNLGSIMQLMQLMNGLQGMPGMQGGQGGGNPLMQVLGSLMGGSGAKK